MYFIKWLLKKVKNFTLNFRTQHPAVNGVLRLLKQFFCNTYVLFIDLITCSSKFTVLLVSFSIGILLISWNVYFYIFFLILTRILIYPFKKYSIYSNSKDKDPLLNFLEKNCTIYYVQLFKKSKTRGRIQRKQVEYLKRKSNNKI